MYIRPADIKNKNLILSSLPINNNKYNLITSIIIDRHKKLFAIKENHTDIKIENIFEFSELVKINSCNLFPENITDYISLHLRLGDKYLESGRVPACVQNDSREFNEADLFNFIEKNINKTLIFFCDNNSYKLKIKNRYNNVITTNCDIGHTGLSTTTEKQTLDGVTEFYLLTKSKEIYSASYSGYPIIASLFKHIPLIKLYKEL